MTLKLSYHLHGKVHNALLLMDNVVLEATNFSDLVEVVMYVMEGGQDQLSDKLIDLTSGNIEIEMMDSAYLTLYKGTLI